MPTKLITSLADLTPDPRNARRHTPRNVGMIADALNEVGAARSIVIDEAGVVLAGNATIEAAAQAGIESVRVVDADGDELIAVRRSGLTAEQKTRLALYDNRAAELAQWDTEVLAALVEDMPDAVEPLWFPDELEAVLDATSPRRPRVTDAMEMDQTLHVAKGGAATTTCPNCGHEWVDE